MKSQRLAALIVASIIIPACFAAGPRASADNQPKPSPKQLLGACENEQTDLCIFRQEGQPVIYNDHYRLAGSSQNCTNSKLVRTVRYELMSGTSNTWGVNMSVGTKLGGIFETTVQGSLQHQWMSSDTTTDETRQDVAPHSAVNIWVSKEKTRIRGTWEIHFGRRYFGHYYWYSHGTVEGQTQGQPWKFSSTQAHTNC